MPETILSPLAKLLGEDFDDLRPLGESGGLSRLFRAHKRSLHMDVVIKRMKIDQNYPTDVQREARVMTGLRHQYLPRIFDLKVDDEGYCYTIMELIPGCTLRQYVQQQGALDQRQVLFWVKQLCQVAEYMHGQRPAIIHSDIKPENIMITPEGNICLIDFNASLEMRDDSVEAIGATMGYAAPEQYNVSLSTFGDPDTLSPELRDTYDVVLSAQGVGKVSVRTDLYAIGAVAYFMLTGYDPPSWNLPAIPLSRYDIVLGMPLRQIIERCMEHAPDKRFSTAQELLRALNGLAKMDSRYRTWRRTCRSLALMICGGIIVSGFCMIWGLMIIRHDAGQAYNELILQAQQSAEKMNFNDEQRLLLQAIELDHERPEAYANLGALLYQQGDYQQAVSLLSDLEINSTGELDKKQAVWAQGQIQYVLASCYYHLQDYHQALTCYQLASYFCPEEVSYQRDLAVCYAKLGYADKAHEAVEILKTLETQPGDSEMVAGEIFYASGQYEQAFELLDQAARTSEDNAVVAKASLQAARCCQQLGDTWLDQEIELLENANRRLSVIENGLHIQMLADAWIRKATLIPSERQISYGQALTYLNDLLDRGNPTIAVQMETALVLEYLERFSESEAILLRLQSDYPHDYRPHMRLALLYADIEGRKPLAQRNYQDFMTHYQQAEALYDDSGVPNSDMERLREVASSLTSR